MTQARFIGDPAHDFDGPEAVAALGVEFIKGEWTPVPDRVATKLQTNNHFETDADHDGGADLTADELREQLDTLGVKYHHRAGVEKLTSLLDEATRG